MPELNDITQEDWLEYEQWATQVEMERKRESEEVLFRSVNGVVVEDICSPDHYTAGGLEAIDVIKAKLTPEEYRGYLKGSALKYMLRANFKGQHDKDILKCAWFTEELDYEITNGPEKA